MQQSERAPDQVKHSRTLDTTNSGSALNCAQVHLMRRVVAALVALAVATCLVGCGGGALFIGVNDGHVTIITVTGVVTSIQIASVVDGGGFRTITVVTFATGDRNTTIQFCGDVANQFELHRDMRVDFQQGAVCSTPSFIVFVG
jgi:hypothetical protein